MSIYFLTYSCVYIFLIYLCLRKHFNVKTMHQHTHVTWTYTQFNFFWPNKNICLFIFQITGCIVKFFMVLTFLYAKLSTHQCLKTFSCRLVKICQLRKATILFSENHLIFLFIRCACMQSMKLKKLDYECKKLLQPFHAFFYFSTQHLQ